MKFLITAIGSMSADAVITSLRNNFPNCQIIGTDIHPRKWLYLSEKVDVFFKITKSYKPDFITSIKSIISEYNVDYILPLTDPEVDVLSKNRLQVENDLTRLTLPNDDVVKLCRNKNSFSTKLKHNNKINLINSYTHEELSSPNFSFPVVAKPIKGRSSEGLRYIRSEIELSGLDENYIIQPFIQGEIITVDFVRDTYGNIASIPRKELIRSSNGAGLSVEIFQDSRIEVLISEIAKALNIIGCVNIEFIKSKNRYYLMDINPRFSAGVGFSSLAGYDFISNHIKVYQGKKIDPMICIKNHIAIKHYKDYMLT